MKIEGRRVLAVGAHPDDVEFFCSGTLLQLKELGCELHVATMSLGDCGSVELPGSQIRLVRRREAEESCRLLGATYHYAGFSDFGFFNDIVTNRRTTALLREVDPWLVITHPPEDYMSDHEITSHLVRNASFVGPAPNFDTMSYTPVEKSSAIPYLYYVQPAENMDIYGRKVTPRFYIDISDQMERKKELLACHESQRNWLRQHHGMDEYLEILCRWNAELGQTATEISGSRVEYAEGYRQHLGHSYPRDNILEEVLSARVILDPSWE
jgi:LmbE family N-acetylglucosaminyl deacetylase